MTARSTDHGGAAPNVALDRFYRLYGAIGFLPIMLVVLIVLFAIFVPHFLVLPNVLNVLRSSSYLVILAVGQMLVLMVGGFDLSVGAVVALTSVSSALVMAGLKGQMADQPALIILAGVLAGLGCGFLVGLVNGLCVAFLSVSPFMVSLGTASIATGSALLLTNGIPVYGMPVGYVDGFGRGLWFKLPSAVYLGDRHRRRRLRHAEFHPDGPLHRRDRRQSAGCHRLRRSDAILSGARPMCFARFSLRSRSCADRANRFGPGGDQFAAHARKHRRRGHRRGEPEGRRRQGGDGRCSAPFSCSFSPMRWTCCDRPAHSDDLPWHHRRFRGALDELSTRRTSVSDVAVALRARSASRRSVGEACWRFCCRS